nr:uncharacterized protein LOC125623662 [Caretta caretta]
MKVRGHNRDPKQCRVKLKELRQAYQKTREANGCSGSEPKTCRFYDELHAILGGSATTTPTVCFDSVNGDGGNMEAGFGDEEEIVDSSQQASGETSFPDSQELFLTLDLEPVPPEPTQGCLPDPPGGEGTSGMERKSSRDISIKLSWMNSQSLCKRFLGKAALFHPTQGCLPDPPGGEGTSGMERKSSRDISIKLSWMNSQSLCKRFLGKAALFHPPCCMCFKDHRIFSFPEASKD